MARSASLKPCVISPRPLLTFLILTAALLMGRSLPLRAAESPVPAIKVDQVGYPMNGPKVALVSMPAASFVVRQSGDGNVAFQGKLGAAKFDPESGDTVQSADFSPLQKPGEYYLEVPGVGRSWDFQVGDNVFQHTYFMAMRAFYGQRCGTAVNLGPDFPGYSHPRCHRHGEFHASSGTAGKRNNVGGWHDAGDYGRYVVNSGITTGALLWTWELFAAKIKNIPLDIPETGNGTPDILNEARWNLRWMLKMQDRDGGVWHKQTSTHFSGFVPPNADHLPSEVIGTGSAPFKSTCATADLAAVAAVAARVYRPFDAKFAARALDAARRAWDWTEKYPNVTFKNPQGISTGEYGDSNCADERLWAAVELWRTTGGAAYHQFFLSQYAGYLSLLDTPPVQNWKEMSPMALESYLLARRKDADPKASAAIRERLLASAHNLVDRTRANPYLMGLQAKDLEWGSNGIAAGYGAELLVADQVEPNPEFVDAARDDLHYLLGRNTFSLSWVTQVGENAVQHPHHRPSASTRLPWPGLLSGGPNAKRQDAILAALPNDLPPAKIYADQRASYASNEIAINWQAALVFLLAGELN